MSSTCTAAASTLKYACSVGRLGRYMSTDSGAVATTAPRIRRRRWFWWMGFCSVLFIAHRRRAEELGAEYNIPFYYHDFRTGWQEGIDLSKEMDLYRQSYCGCIYSEQERYDKRCRKKKKKAG